MGIGGVYANEVPDGGTFEAGDNILVARGPYVVSVPKDELPSSSGGGLGIREDASFSAMSLANNATTSNTVNIASRYQLLQITTSHPCRVRLYTSIAKRDADLTRSIGTDPTGDHGLMFEFISTTELLSADLSPVVDGFAETVAIPYSITNLSGATQTITVTLNHVKTGAGA